MSRTSKATIALMGTQDHAATSPFHGHIDTAKVGAVGHSAGGAAVEALAATDPKVATFIGLAGATVGSFGQSKKGPGSIVPHQPGLLMSGTSDQVVKTSSIVSAYGHLHSPKRLILIRGAGHLVFADLCEVGSGQGGLLAIAAALKVPIPASLKPLATDGCIGARPVTAIGLARHPPGGDGAVPPRLRVRPLDQGPGRSGRGLPGHRVGRSGRLNANSRAGGVS